ncbi:MAG: A/G-specific adenine glycosylase [Hespellia sp.]|jgi:A/G-specific adenine glycosylase|nr:A/G-specific adenine glycosylase [Hespellia sp.]
MKYERITDGTFLERPNRFIAYAELNGRRETIHVKNTGRCGELFRRGAHIYVQENKNPQRKTKWDLIGVEKGTELVNVDSQIPNQVVREWVETGNLYADVTMVKPEVTYGSSRFDLYVEAGSRKILIEVKGVTLEQDGIARFPDAPSERAVKHVQELARAVKEGYEAYVFFVIQMKGIRYFTPNMTTHAAFGEALLEAVEAGVHVIAYDCEVGKDSIEISSRVPVALREPSLANAVKPLIAWYRENKRDLPWRKDISAYHVWVSEIMLQQTRVEAVKPYYERFLQELPAVDDLAQISEDRLLKLWEGLGYYNRVRNMQQAAQQIMELYEGKFPEDYESIRSLKGIGNYTAGAIASFAYGIPKPAVDGNVLRVISRFLGSEEDIMKAKVRTRIEMAVEEVIPEDAASDFNQGLIELGAIVCVPNGLPKCEICPLQEFCLAKAQNRVMELPVKSKAKGRRIEQKTILLFEDQNKIAIRKRPAKGLLASLYEFPNLPGHLEAEEVVAYSKTIGLTPVRVRKMQEAKHIFSHVEWHMIGYRVQVDELEKNCTEPMLFVAHDELENVYPIPTAFEAYR